jgi:glycosyltransferase involved in cell wall biosynthesis
MKIAFFHELNTGGARRCVNEFATNLKERHQVDVYIVDENWNKAEEKYFTKVFFYKFKPKPWHGKNWKNRLYKDTLELYKINLLHRKIAKTIDNEDYDIVIVNPSKYTQAPFILKFLKTKKIYYGQEPLRIVYDDLLSSKNTSQMRLIYERINRQIRKFIDKQNFESAEICVAPSKYRAKIFSDIYHRKVSVIYCGVNTQIFKDSKQKKKDIDLLYIGSHNIIDGYDTFTDSLQFIKNKPTVRAILTDQEWISGDDKLRDIYQRSKMLVCTARKEGLGLSTLEAMACATPVVAVAEAGHKETVVDNKTGFLVPRNPHVIAQKISWLLTYPMKAKTFGENGRKEILSKWTWKNRTKELENVILDTIGETR